MESSYTQFIEDQPRQFFDRLPIPYRRLPIQKSQQRDNAAASAEVESDKSSSSVLTFGEVKYLDQTLFTLPPTIAKTNLDSYFLVDSGEGFKIPYHPSNAGFCDIYWRLIQRNKKNVKKVRSLFTAILITNCSILPPNEESKSHLITRVISCIKTLINGLSACGETEFKHRLCVDSGDFIFSRVGTNYFIQLLKKSEKQEFYNRLPHSQIKKSTIPLLLRASTEYRFYPYAIHNEMRALQCCINPFGLNDTVYILGEVFFSASDVVKQGFYGIRVEELHPPNRRYFFVSTANVIRLEVLVRSTLLIRKLIAFATTQLNELGEAQPFVFFEHKSSLGSFHFALDMGHKFLFVTHIGSYLEMYVAV